MNTPLINGTRHSWANIRINMLGRTVTGVVAIAYDDTQEKTNNYGAGIYPVSRGRGRYEATAKITLHKYEVEAIETAAAGARLQAIPSFDIIVAYLPTGQDEVRTDIIRNCEFRNNKRDIKEGDTMIGVELDLIVSHIDWGGTTVN
jgi:hypothetical protein